MGVSKTVDKPSKMRPENTPPGSTMWKPFLGDLDNGYFSRMG